MLLACLAPGSASFRLDRMGTVSTNAVLQHGIWAFINNDD